MRRLVRIYCGLALMMPKQMVAYNASVWIKLLVQIMSLTTFYYFWRAVYTDRTIVAGLALHQTLNYALLAQVFLSVVQSNPVYALGKRVVDGNIAIDLVRPVDLQAAMYAQNVADILVSLVVKPLLLGIAIWLFGLTLPTDPSIWIWFLISLFLGNAALFCFDWIVACLTFYTTEAWGLVILRNGVAMFFSGAIVPLEMMPSWLRHIIEIFPFSQALYIPVALLSGLTPVTQALEYSLIQLAWIGGLAIASRIVFVIAVRKVTVQGG